MDFIGVDLGTSFIKGAVLDLDEMRLKEIERLPFPKPIQNLPPLFYEVDPTGLVQTTRELILRLLHHTKGCAGIVMCSQMHGLLLTDPTGNPRSNVITWLDERASGPFSASGEGTAADSTPVTYFEQMMKQVTETERQELGNGLRPGLPICTLFWLAQHQALAEKMIPLSLPDFVLQGLTDEWGTPGVEPTNAAAYGAMNLKTGEWHWPLLAKLGLDKLQWPTIQQVADKVGQIEIAGQKLPCYRPVGDHQCALLGAFLSNRELSMNIATGSQVSLVTSALVPDVYETRPYFDGRFLNTFVKIPAGRSLTHLVDLLTEIPGVQGVELADPWLTIAQMVEEVDQTDLDIDLSFFASAQDGNQGKIDNIREDNLSVGHLFRAAFGRMANDYYAYGMKLSPTQDWDRLVFSGGLAQKLPPLRSEILDRFDSPHRLCTTSEDALQGLLVLALYASGRASSVDAAVNLVQQNEATVLGRTS